MPKKRTYTISRVWAMPNSRTFEIPPIKELIDRHIKAAKVIIDPFANESKIGTITNDLNPHFDTDYHLDALTFLQKQKSAQADVVLFDPPYNVAQASECYKAYGVDKLDINVSNALYWGRVRTEISRVLKRGGVCISFGWSTVGVGKKNGMRVIEILDVCHGGSHYDTLVTVEIKE